jgi:hypothetical protein
MQYLKPISSECNSLLTKFHNFREKYRSKRREDRENKAVIVATRPPQSVATCRLSARHILKKAILQAHLSKKMRILMIYKGRHIIFDYARHTFRLWGPGGNFVFFKTSVGLSSKPKGLHVNEHVISLRTDKP